MLSMFLVFMVGWAHEGISIEEEERKALLEIKASLVGISNSYDNLLPSWTADDRSSYCDWERISCNSTSSVGDNYKYVDGLSLGNLFSMEETDYYTYNDISINRRMMWPLNFSIFLHFKELRKLDLSYNSIGNTTRKIVGIEEAGESQPY
ncbi:hypothetical protein E3N88_23045 [Mikania micrantha]|uniref:Leucine-rich repeat-containing N-terminal plant-type domain-containing protein n=1 Tax=Mikania micrantha TaxID=192012 RepID=A0A5N6NCE3_9ASTR|nr:hypothetical protein E3N88_23045 [Mikania micrantha]